MRVAGGSIGMGIVALMFGAVSVSAQEKTTVVRGVVSDDEGRRLEGASIEVLGTKLAATTAADGAFRFDRVPAGRYWIVVRRIGYAPVRLTATFLSGRDRDLPIELERVPQRLSELTVLSHGGMSKYRYQDFFTRSHSAFGTFLTRDDLAESRAYDLVSLVQRHMPGKTRFALEQRTGGDGYAGGRLYRRGGYLYGRDEFGFFVPVGTSALGLYQSPNCAPAISLNGATPWPGVSLLDFDLGQVEALEIYRRGSWVPTEFSYRESSGCGLVVVWTR